MGSIPRVKALPDAAVRTLSIATIDNAEVLTMLLQRIKRLADDGEPLLDIVRRLNPTTNNRCPVCDRPGRGDRASDYVQPNRH